MIVYNQAFDIYHTIYRFLQFLKKFEEGTYIEIERIRIWDFYLLFPNKVHDIRLKQSESDIRKLKKTYIKDPRNPYNQITENRKVFEKIKPYQFAALNCLASYGILDKATLTQQKIKVINKAAVDEMVRNLDVLPPKEQNTVALMTSHFYKMSLFGTDGLKNRTDLMESKYDA